MTRDQLAALALAAVVYAAGAAIVAIGWLTSWWVTGAIGVIAVAGAVWWWLARVPRVWRGL